MHQKTFFLLCLFAISLGLTTISFAQNDAEEAQLQIFDSAVAAVKSAQKSNKQIVFFLFDERDAAQKQVYTTFAEELNRMETHFVLVRSESGRASNKAMFTETFKKDISKMPIALVTDSKGKEIATSHGTDFTGYEKMLINAHIKSGTITDPLELAMLKDRLKRVGEKPERIGEGFLSPLADEIRRKKSALSPVRVWQKKDGSDFKGILLEAHGDHGSFIDMRGDSSKIKFIDLSEDDIKYLKTILSTQPK